jgi:Rad3-related DNA helicase
MREMQARAFDARNAQYLLLKAPPASGKSRALMYIALDKLTNQGLKKVIVAVPERTIGSSFRSMNLKRTGFWADWVVNDPYNLTTVDGERKTQALKKFLESDEKILICTHATLRFAYADLRAEAFAECLVAIDEFHHTSADADSKLGELVRGLIADGRAHIVAMTGSYFRGDTIPVLRPEDEAQFTRVTYTYYEQLARYEHLKTLSLGYYFHTGHYVDSIAAVIDTTKKTIIHIPSVNSAAAGDIDKNEQVGMILDALYDNHDSSKLTTDEGHGIRSCYPSRSPII